MNASKKPFPAESFAMLANAEENNWWFKSRNELIIWVLQRKVDTFKDYLEVGCGTGFVLSGVRASFRHANIFGSEYYEEGLEFARRRVPDASFARLDAVQMQDEENFDVIGAFDVIEHIEEDEIVLKNLARALRPGGSIVITVPQHMWLWSPVDENACHVRRYSRIELLEKLHKTELKTQYVTSFVSLLLPLMWASRLFARSSENQEKNELHVARPLNFFLAMVMKFEFLIIKMGFRLQLGGSLLVVAKKSN